VFDCVTMCHAIHIMPDKQKVLAAITRVLKPGGFFGVNPSFYAGTYVKGTEEHFYIWLKHATLYIEQVNKKRRAEGKNRIKRTRGKSHGAFQDRWLSEAEWTDLLANAGMKVHDRNERAVTHNERCLRAIGAYAGLVEVLLSGYPLEIASEALQATAKQTLDEMDMQAVQRNYLEIWATKNPS